jgi:hypothetical protein
MSDKLWNCEREIRSLGIEVPDWIDQEIVVNTIPAITQGGCESGAYMPAVTYYEARKTMADYGDEVLQFIEHSIGSLPEPPKNSGWDSLAVHYLSYAVELWAFSIESDLEDLLDEAQEATP